MGHEKSEKNYGHGGAISWVRLKYSGLYDLDALLGAARGWFNKMKYFVIDTEHSEAVKSSGKDITIIWEPERNVNDYVKFQFKLEISIYREIDVLVEEHGKKVRKQQGDMEIRFRNVMVKNYRQTFRGPAKEFLRKTYEKYLIRSELDDYRRKLMAEGEDFWTAIKKTVGGFTK